MPPFRSPARQIHLGVALGAALVTAGTATGCLYDSTGPDALLTEDEIRLVFQDLVTSVLHQGSRGIAFGTQSNYRCGSMTLGQLDPETSSDTTMAFSYLAIPRDCHAWNASGPDILYSGAPDVGGDAQATEVEGVLVFLRVTGFGGVSYRTVDGRKGTCVIDMVYGFERPAPHVATDRWWWEGAGCGLSLDTVMTRSDFQGTPITPPR